MDSYTLSRSWFNWCFENPEKVSPNHSALYFFIIEHCNRLGWKEKFGLPMEMAKDAIGIKNYRTYSKTFNDLIEWGFITLIQQSKNQYSSNIIAIAKNTKATTKALDKAMIKHVQKHSQKQVHGIVGIDKQETLNQEQETYRAFAHLKISIKKFEDLKLMGYTQQEIDSILDDIENYKDNKKYGSLFLTAKKWLKREKTSEKKEKTGKVENVLSINQQVKEGIKAKYANG